ncbi:MAG: type II toxin-antitoxin system MqsR family toxin [Thermomonas sp.]|uniref:type II toxin-antitoxin system MqsR family toxin n=1 Tax=Thermomonas sp. TaxID=1971895 RepID=UPI0039E54797
MPMEKRTPHCRLSRVKALAAAGMVRATKRAASNAREMGVKDNAGLCAVVMGLTARDFYKSMTTHIDYRVWQDVYHARTVDGVAVYLKLTVIDDVLIVSFKEL